MARAARLVAATAVAILAGLVAWPQAGAAADGEIASDGPLTRIITTPDLNCQVAHRADLNFEFYGQEVGACGTFLAVAGRVFGPASIPPVGLVATEVWQPVSQTAVTGSGSGGDPFRVVTVAQVVDLGLRIEQTDSYRIGEESYRTDVRITNGGVAELRGTIFRAGDCYLQDSDTGYGRIDQWRTRVRHLRGVQCPDRAVAAAHAGQSLHRGRFHCRLAAGPGRGAVPGPVSLRR